MRYITDDIKISSDESDGEKIETKYLAKTFLPRLPDKVRPQKRGVNKYWCEQCKILPEDEKERLVEYREKYYKIRKKACQQS